MVFDETGIAEAVFVGLQRVTDEDVFQRFSFLGDFHIAITHQLFEFVVHVGFEGVFIFILKGNLFAQQQYPAGTEAVVDFLDHRIPLVWR